MASATAILPILLLLTFSTLSLSFPDQFGTPNQDIGSLASTSSTLAGWAATESSIPTSTLLSELSSHFNNHDSGPVPASITGLHERAATAASSLLVEAPGLVESDFKPTLRGHGGSTVTVAQSTRTIATNRVGNGTGASTGMPSKSANGTDVTTSSAVMRVGNATVLPPLPVIATAGPKMHTKSEAGRDVGKGMGTGMGILVAAGLWVCGVMVFL